MPSGGKRTGAGRKKGSITRMSMEAREHAKHTGELPHEFLLRIVRGEKIGSHRPTFKERVDAAKAAAPYFQPRIAAQEVSFPKEQRPIDRAALDRNLKLRFVRLGLGKALPGDRKNLGDKNG